MKIPGLIIRLSANIRIKLQEQLLSQNKNIDRLFDSLSKNLIE